ncbi:MAG: leucyl/phenylalanyl-tRNA--protein transferase [Zymomonas mobilis]|uniref:leucyl/phenylalanyl-tRNA--protein transferase n=1 Tax=Zymomonas mobilis TaxID=542 RepID=UPI0039EC67C1
MTNMIDPHLLLSAYATGIFPMSDSRETDEVYWVEPKKRGILPLDHFHLSRSLAKIIRSDRFLVTADRDFEAVIDLCAEPTEDRPDSWINPPIRAAYCQLHNLGYAHSIECWLDNRLVGGLYGVNLGYAFFGESMFSRVSNASKVALAWLVARLKVGNFRLLDCQFITDHLASMGAIEITREDYLKRLKSAVSSYFTDKETGNWNTLDRLSPLLHNKHSKTKENQFADADLPFTEGTALETDGTAAGDASFSLACPNGARIVQLLGQIS